MRPAARRLEADADRLYSRPMDLWLLRHAAAEDRAPSGRDRDRSLTSDGAQRAAEVGRGLAVLAPGFAAIWTSPYRRARQTAEAAARALGFPDKLQEIEALEPEKDPEEVLEELRQAGEGPILLVGHQPHMGALLGLLVTGSDLEIPLKKAAVARVEMRAARSGTLRALLPPRVLERLGARRE